MDSNIGCLRNCSVGCCIHASTIRLSPSIPASRLSSRRDETIHKVRVHEIELMTPIKLLEGEIRESLHESPDMLNRRDGVGLPMDHVFASTFRGDASRKLGMAPFA
jgi:hypothetical protein